MRRALLSILLLQACRDPTIDLVFGAASPYREEIATILVQVIEPSREDPFSCEELAYGYVAEERRAIQLEVSLRAQGTAPIAGVDRLAPKVLLAHGVDANGSNLVVACAEVGEISEDLEVELDAEPVAYAYFAGETSFVRVLGAGPPAPLPLAIVDTYGRPLAGTPIELVVASSNGVFAGSQVLSGSDGTVDLLPDLPDSLGPLVVEVRAKNAEPLFAPGMVALPPLVADLGAYALDHRIARRGADTRIAVLMAEAGSTEVWVDQWSLSAETRELARSTSAALAGPAVLGSIEASTAGDDRVVVVSADAWTELLADGALVPGAPPVAGVAPTSAFPLPGCADAGPSLLLNYGSFESRIQGPDGEDTGFVTEPLPVIAAGCATDQDGRSHRMLAYAFSELGIFLQSLEEGFFSNAWLALAQGIAFLPPDAGGRRLVVGTQLSESEFTVARARVDRYSDSLYVSTEERDPVPGVPIATRAGDLDGDGALDVVALISFPLGGDEQQSAGYLAWVISSRAHAGRRLAGPVPLEPAPYFYARGLELADLDGDGADEWIIVDRLLEDPASLSADVQRSRLFVYDISP